MHDPKMPYRHPHAGPDRRRRAARPPRPPVQDLHDRGRRPGRLHRLVVRLQRTGPPQRLSVVMGFVLILGVAFLKAFLVGFYFMHLKWDWRMLLLHHRAGLHPRRDDGHHPHARLRDRAGPRRRRGHRHRQGAAVRSRPPSRVRGARRHHRRSRSGIAGPPSVARLPRDAFVTHRRLAVLALAALLAFLPPVRATDRPDYPVSDFSLTERRRPDGDEGRPPRQGLDRLVRPRPLPRRQVPAGHADDGAAPGGLRVPEGSSSSSPSPSIPTATRPTN